MDSTSILKILRDAVCGMISIKKKSGFTSPAYCWNRLFFNLFHLAEIAPLKWQKVVDILQVNGSEQVTNFTAKGPGKSRCACCASGRRALKMTTSLIYRWLRQETSVSLEFYDPNTRNLHRKSPFHSSLVTVWNCVTGWWFGTFFFPFHIWE